ncbi:MAG: DUF3822 family protein [Bacteroidia bacterium]|nr:DUF3822 family protein [Bacteroidia bacterium]
MRNIAIIDDSFDSNLISSYHLSIQYCEQFCSFAILDAARMKYIAFKNFWFDNPVPAINQADHIRSLLHGESYLTRQFKSVFFMYVTPLSVLVPTPLFRKENPEVYFKFSSQILPTDRIFFRRIPAIDAYILFPMQEEILTRVGIILNDVQIFHQSCSQIDEAIAESRDSADRTRVLANINPGFVDLMIIQSDRLLLYNSFAIKNTNDLVFFILYMYEQFSLSQEDSLLVLSGFVEMYPGTIELLNQYLKKIVIREFPKSYTYSHTFNCLTQHHYSQLINLAGCG